MRWPNLVGKVRAQPVTGRWHEWKQAIADDCEGRCVYCAIAEARFGGIRNFHVEHFRPKIKFPAFENDIKNLYVACSICNVLKGDDWPCEPVHDHSLATYPDPSKTDYNTVFTVSPRTYEVSSPTLAGAYIVERILLNRAQLVLERRVAGMLSFLSEFNDWVRHTLGSMTRAEARATIKILLEISQTQTSVLEARPYRDADAKRRAKPTGRKKR